MNRVLVIYYSQSGEVARVARLFADQLASSQVEVTFEEIRPQANYPYPWRSLRRFFDEMPECVLGLPPQVHAPQFDRHSRFNLVVIAYPVWFLSLAPPIQSFFQCPHSIVLRNADVITISVSRAMWQRASEAMKQLLMASGAVHCDNIVVTHQGSSLLTLISTPRALLSGRRDRLLGVFPPAGVSGSDLDRVQQLGSVVARELNAGSHIGRSRLRGEPAVAVDRWLAVPEFLAWYCFYVWAALIRRLGRVHPALRALGDYAFATFLVGLILFGLPLIFLGTFVTYPTISHRLNAYISHLAEPTGIARRYKK